MEFFVVVEICSYQIKESNESWKIEEEKIPGKYIAIEFCWFHHVTLWDTLKCCPNQFPGIQQCQHTWKIDGITFQCLQILQSRRQGPISCWKYVTYLFLSFLLFRTLFPRCEDNNIEPNNIQIIFRNANMFGIPGKVLEL